MRSVDTSPGDESSETRDVDKPVEHGGRSGRLVEEAKQTECGSEDDSDIGNTSIRSVGQELRCMAFIGKTYQNTRTRIDV